MKLKKLLALPILLSLFQINLFADLTDTVRKQLPVEYYSRCDEAGTTELLKYVTNGRAKTAVVYLPYGYDSENKDVTYPVLFLMHGGGGSSTSYMGIPGSPNQLCWIIDNAIKQGEIEPLIVVCPSDTGGFPTELRNFLLPKIDSTYNTKADRAYRAIGGFSMGSVTTWNAYMHDLDLIKNFVPMSGDSWVCGSTGGRTFPEQTATALTKAQYIDEYKDDFLIFAATGTNDSAYPNLQPQITAMKELPDTFKYTTNDFSEGNLIFYVVQGYIHSYNCTYEYLLNGLRLFFKD